MEELIRLTLNCIDNSSDNNKGVHNFVEIIFNDNDNIVQVMIMITLAVVEIEIVIVYTMISNNNDASDAVVIIHT